MMEKKDLVTPEELYTDIMGVNFHRRQVSIYGHLSDISDHIKTPQNHPADRQKVCVW
jgi:hypothetical protein